MAGKEAFRLSPPEAENRVSPGFLAQALVQPAEDPHTRILGAPMGWAIPLPILGFPPSHPRFATWQAAWAGHARAARS